jgi:hypothetical protein
MKSAQFIAMICLLLSTSNALTAQTKVSTMAEKVTIFINGAQVTRTKQADVPAGNSSLVFTGLSPYLDAKSMQISAMGKLTVTGVNHQFNYTDSMDVSERQKSLQNEIKAIEKQEKEQNAALEQLKAEREMVKANCSLDGKASTSTSLATIKEINLYYAEQLKMLLTKELSINEQLNGLRLKRAQLAGELSQLTDKRREPMSEVVVGIQAPAACRATFTLSYYVKNAGWFPSYDIRSGNITEPITLLYKANIFQNTKEDWQNVSLTLSSSNPTTDNVAPTLMTYWLDYGLAPPTYNLSNEGSTVYGIVMDEARKPLIGTTVSIPNTTIGTVTDMNGRYSLTLPSDAQFIQFNYIGYQSQTKPLRRGQLNIVMEEDEVEVDEVVVLMSSEDNEVEAMPMYIAPTEAPRARARVKEAAAAPLPVQQAQTQTGYEFDIRQPYTIPSDNKPIVAEIGKYDIPASYTYQSTPKIDKDAFLVAQITDWEKLNLLDGEAGIYFDNTFIGNSVVSVAQAGDTLTFSLGRDKRIALQRTKEQEYTSRQWIGNNQTQSMAWKISVRNTRQEPVTLLLHDQLPVSRNKSITVTPTELTPGYTLDESNGLLTWKLELKPGEQRDISMRYQVKYPKDQRLTIE